MAVNVVRTNPKHFTRDQIPILLVLVPVALLMGAPLVYIIAQAFKPLDELFIYPPTLLPGRPTLDNFYELMDATAASGIPMGRYIFNSLVTTVATVALSLLLTTMAAFILSKVPFRFKEPMMELNNAAMMFVAVAVQIPRYLIISGMGIMDTYLAHILPIVAMPVCLFLIKQFIDQLPDELLDAVQIDGAGSFRMYYKIVLPLIRPAIATGTLLVFQAVWNNMETSSLFTSREGMRTLAFYLNTMSDTATVQGRGLAAAASFILFIPNLLLFIVMQTNVMNTMAHSGLKG